MTNVTNGYRAFFILWLGQLISSVGSGMTSFGLNVYVFNQTGNAAACSAVLFCAFVPMVLLTPIAGVFADRFSRKTLMMLGESFSAVGLFLLLALIHFKRDSLILMCICVLISNTFAALTDPAFRAAITDLLTPEQYSKAGGLIQLASAAKFLISPALAGFIMDHSDIQIILLIDICTFLTTAIAILITGDTLTVCQKLDTGKKVRFTADLKEGWDFILNQKGLLILLILVTLVTFYVGFIETLLTPMLLEFTSASKLGTVTAISAVGMLFTSVILGIKGIDKDYIKKLSASLVAMGVFISLIGITYNVIILTIIGFMFFAMLPITNTCIDVLIRSTLESDTQGRVWGFISLISQFGYIIAYAISGPLADNVFNPMLHPDGILAKSFGHVVGVGEERGIALMMILCGLSMIVLSVIIYSNRKIKYIEAEYMNMKSA